MLFGPVSPLFAAILIGSLAMAAAAWAVPKVGRGLYCAMFAIAAAVNSITALLSPAAYVDLWNFSFTHDVGAFVAGAFSDHVRLVVCAVALGQALVALGLFLGGGRGRAAVGGAFVFLVAMAPLGAGSAFPSTLVLAFGAILLLRGRALEGELRIRHGSSPRASRQRWRHA